MATTIEPKIVNALLPITALAYIRLGTSEPYLLAGEGQFLKVFDNQERDLIYSERLFESQAIHGIACKCSPPNAGTLLIWGGRLACLVSIEADADTNGKPLIRAHQILPETSLDDWIHDGLFLYAGVNDNGSGENTVEAVLVTAHNNLIGLKLNGKDAEMRKTRSLYRIASGPSSILYSAHLHWVNAGRRLLVAAGTVLGKVLLWSFTLDEIVSPKVCVHYRYVGHEGSVFGVRISDVEQTGDVKRIVASCSDDRTIRIWNISDTVSEDSLNCLADGELTRSGDDLVEAGSETVSTGCLATIMGHASRIWGLRFLVQKPEYWDFITYGEDSTAQVWRVSRAFGKGRAVVKPHKHAYQLSHRTTYSYHSGKNLWAMAIFQEDDDECSIATGGADGRITTYKFFPSGAPARTHTWTSQHTMDGISKLSENTHAQVSPRPAPKTTSSTETIFKSLKGSWRLSRNIDSVLSTYPSGTLEGTAKFAERLPTGNKYDMEYLYSESGDFKTQHGLTMKATRQYVYRYSRSADAISVWFVKPEDGSSVDYFFHQLDFRDTDPGVFSGLKVRTAGGYHLCVGDNYKASYSFQTRDSSIALWHATFDVDGPKKGYVAKATYTRDQAEDLQSEDTERLPSPASDNHITLDKQSEQNKPDIFKTYTWLSESEVLATTEEGRLLIGTITGTSNLNDSWDLNWEPVGHRIGLASSSIATSISSLGVALLTGTDGTVYFYSHPRRDLKPIGELPGKAGFLRAHALSEPWNTWLRLSDHREAIGLFATCLGSSQATVFVLPSTAHATSQLRDDEAAFPAIFECNLTLPSKFIVTSSCFVDTERYLILGSRNGDIAIYDLGHTTPDSTVDVKPDCFPGIHGEDAITQIQTVPQNPAKRFCKTAIITAGRDGRWAIHQLSHRSASGPPAVTLQTIHADVPPFGPNIEGAHIDSTNNDLLLWGFRSKQFVVWNESQKTEVMTVDCGGAHRNWSYIPRQDGGGGGSFIYTKASVCHIHSQRRASHQVVQQGGHGREIKAIAVSPVFRTDNNGKELRLLATGAEDTEIRLFDLNGNLKCLSVISKHTTGIQQLKWSPNGHILFSAAGCEEFFVWRIRSAAPLITVGVVCEAHCPPVTEDEDLRIMDFAIEEIQSAAHGTTTTSTNNEIEHEHEPKDYLLSIIYSDSSLRIFHYRTSPETNPNPKPTFTLLTKASYITHCLTAAAHLHFPLPGTSSTTTALCTASTDGHLAFWPLPLFSHPPTPPSLSLTPTLSPPLHPSAIKALSTIPLTSSSTLIATTGDDGALAFTLVTMQSNPSAGKTIVFDIRVLFHLPTAHAGAVTGGAFLPTTTTTPPPPPPPLLLPAHGFSEEEEEQKQEGKEKEDEEDEEEEEEGKEEARRLGFVTFGPDQRVKSWHLSFDPATDTDTEIVRVQERERGMKMRRGKDKHSGVGDGSRLVAYWVRDREGERGEVVVAGIGVERWRWGV